MCTREHKVDPPSGSLPAACWATEHARVKFDHDKGHGDKAVTFPQWRQNLPDRIPTELCKPASPFCTAKQRTCSTHVGTRAHVCQNGALVRRETTLRVLPPTLTPLPTAIAPVPGRQPQPVSLTSHPAMILRVLCLTESVIKGKVFSSESDCCSSLTCTVVTLITYTYVCT